MEYVINVLIYFLFYISIPVTIRYVILRKPIESNWVVIAVLVPIFIGFSIFINIQRDEGLKKIHQELNVPYKPEPHMVGSPILYIAMALSYYILRRGHKKSKTMIDQSVRYVPTTPAVTGVASINSSESGSQLTQKSMITDKPHISQEQGDVDEDRIYAAIAKELETGATEKGLWTRLFAECGGDEKQTKVLYIKQRAERLISAERARLERVAQERAAEARTAELVQRKTMELSGVIEQLRLKGYQIKKITSGWKVREPLGGRIKLGSDGALLEYASGQVGAPTELKSQLPRHREVPHSNDGKNLEDISDEIIPLFDDENSDKNKK